jgi:hypothetical protein
MKRLKFKNGTWSVSMRTQSCKAKGRKLQQYVANKIKEHFFLPDADVKSLPMGSQGADVWLSTTARECFPFDIECKAQEKLNIWDAFKQAKEYGPNPLVVFTRNRSEVLCTLTFDNLLNILESRYVGADSSSE